MTYPIEVGPIRIVTLMFHDFVPSHMLLAGREKVGVHCKKLPCCLAAFFQHLFLAHTWLAVIIPHRAARVVLVLVDVSLLCAWQFLVQLSQSCWERSTGLDVFLAVMEQPHIMFKSTRERPTKVERESTHLGRTREGWRERGWAFFWALHYGENWG